MPERRFVRHLPSAMLALGATLAAYAAWTARTGSIWADEAYSLLAAAQTWRDVIPHAIGFQRQGPVYFVALKAWSTAFPGLVGARTLSLLCVLGAAALLATTKWRDDEDEYDPQARACVFMLTPYCIWAAAEARGYALELLLLAANFRAFSACLRSSAGVRTIAAFVLTSVLAWLNFYPAVLVSAAFALVALLYHGRAVAVRVVGALAAASLVFAPYLLVVREQMRSSWFADAGAEAARAEPGWLERLHSAAVNPVHGIFHAPVLERVPFAVFCSLLLLAYVRWSRASQDDDARRRGAGEAVLLLVPAVGLFVVGSLTGMVVDRYSVILVVPFAVAAWRLLERASGAAPRFVPLTAGAVVLAMLASFVRNNIAVQDWKSAARVLAERRRSDEPILVHDAHAALALRFYLGRTAEIRGLPDDVPYDAYLERRFAVTSEAQVGERVRALVPAGGAFWVAINEFQPVWWGRQHVRDFLAESTTVSDSSTFYNVRLYRATLR